MPSNIAERAVNLGYGRALVDAREFALVAWVYSHTDRDIDALIHQFFKAHEQ